MEIEKQPALFSSGGGAKPGPHNPILQNQADIALSVQVILGRLDSTGRRDSQPGLPS